jgi:predicted metal-dependent phosphoesterase TrpH
MNPSDYVGFEGDSTRTPADLSPIGHSDSKFIMNGIGMTPTPEVAQIVQSYLTYVAESTRSHQTGATYVDILELDGATPERVRAAYSPEDWERLVALKDRYDPGNTFRFDRNILPSSG